MIFRALTVELLLKSSVRHRVAMAELAAMSATGSALLSETEQIAAESSAVHSFDKTTKLISIAETSSGRKRHPSPDLIVPPSKRKRQKEDIVQIGNLSHIKYYFENGLRKVEPYYFTWKTHAKGRWLGQAVGNVFLEEFGAANEEVAQAHVNGEPSLIFVNGQSVTKDYKIKSNDFISHYVHRHEAPITDRPLKIIAETEDILVIDKPSSIPIHPCGRFRANSVMYIMAIEHGRPNLRVVHRLDRLTSGLLLMGKTVAAAQNFHDQLVERAVKKTYLARVRGHFPPGTTACEDSIDCLNKRAGIHQVAESGRGCVTEFSLIRYDPTANTSVVECRPLTGRTHQIRVHLQHLGYPIVNDPVYGSLERWRPQTAETKEDPQSELELESVESSTNPTSAAEAKKSDPKRTVVIPFPNGVVVNPDKKGAGDDFDEWDGKSVRYKKLDKLPDKEWADPLCPECWLEFQDPSEEELRLDLHCWKYEGMGWKYETDMPDWAKDSDSS